MFRILFSCFACLRLCGNHGLWGVEKREKRAKRGRNVASKHNNNNNNKVLHSIVDKVSKLSSSLLLQPKQWFYSSVLSYPFNLYIKKIWTSSQPPREKLNLQTLFIWITIPQCPTLLEHRRRIIWRWRFRETQNTLLSFTLVWWGRGWHGYDAPRCCWKIRYAISSCSSAMQ